MPDIASMARDTLYALLTTYLATASQDIASHFADVQTGADGYRVFEFEGQTLIITQRAPNDVFIMPGVNVYFGDDVAQLPRVKPRRWVLPVIIHVMVDWTGQKMAGAKLSRRLSELIMQAFEGLGGRIQVYDLSQSPPVPIADRFVSWVLPQPLVWREESDPSKEVYTNRMFSFQVRYAR